MRKYFDEEPHEKSRGKGDTELTLGSWTLLTVFFGLVVLCGLCFGLGYAVGSHGSKGPVFQSQPPAAGPSPQMPANSQDLKPSAAAQPAAVPMQPMTAVDPGTVQGSGQVPPPGSASGSPVVTSASAVTSSPVAGQQGVASNAAGWHAVQPALPGGTGTMQGAQPTTASTVQPAMSGQASMMVQIAALSNQEDAGVLMGALRRRGYAVSAVRSPADNLIHVCVGPFSNRMDANAMRQKLLSDGYNAVVLP